jgi:4-hydroxythreonine-4-phosphate dehydrogenase
VSDVAQHAERAKPGRGAALAPLALSGGDPAGIGLDIALEAWWRRNERGLAPFAIYADKKALASRRDRLGLDVPLQTISSNGAAAVCFSRALPVMEIACEEPVTPGRPSSRNGRAVIRAIEQATAAVAHGEACALVTNPIAKHVLYDADFRHPGHTEFLADLATQHFPGRTYTPVMMLACDALRVVPLTIHVALAAVPALITPAAIETALAVMDEALRRDYGIGRPRIAVAGLNPHAGENGTMGTEDRDIVAPAVARARASGLDVRGPLSADTLFHAAARPSYDAVLAMYHDQALIPIKTLAFDTGVNVTLGLPFVRTSPDHGTAFDIAGSGQASCESLIAALQMAASMAERRSAGLVT